MNSFVIASVLLTCSSLALGGPIGSPLARNSVLMELRDAPELTRGAAAQIRNTRQLGLSSALTSAIGGGVGLVPGVGSLLSAPVSSLLQRPLSSTFSALTGGLITRIGDGSEWQPLWSPAQAQPWAAAAGAAAPFPLQYRQLQPDQPLLYMLN